MNPIVTTLTRAGAVESVHRGAWVVVDSRGSVIDHRGEPDQMVFARSATKSMQVLPLIESGAADRFGFSAAELAVSVASHSAEPAHTEIVAGMLDRLGLAESDLRCGAARPWFSGPDAIERRLHHCCSGKHAAFLAFARHLATDTATYLESDHPIQVAVRQAVLEMTGAEQLDTATDGCGAPTFRMPLVGLATGLARLTNPAGLAPDRAEACRRVTEAVATHPTLVAGATNRLCSDLARATAGRLFAKMGADGIYVVGVVGGDAALAVTIDDGAERGVTPLVMEVATSQSWLSPDELDTLNHWHDPVRRNAAGEPVGAVEVHLA